MFGPLRTGFRSASQTRSAEKPVSVSLVVTIDDDFDLNF